MMDKGLIHIYTGNGKGKTTAAAGLCTRAAGCGLKILFVQFFKNGRSGENVSFLKLDSNIELMSNKQADKFSWQMNEEERLRFEKKQKMLFCKVIEKVKTNNFDILVLDEISSCINKKIIEINDVKRFLTDKPKNMEVVLTGRNMNMELIDMADYVTKMDCVKHPARNGIKARKGIEF